MRNYKLPRMASVDTLRTLALQGQDSRSWYPDARKQVTAASVVLDVSHDRLADLLSLFSPRVSVARSVRMSVHYIRTGGYLHATMRTIRASVEHYQETGIIRGPKTGAFARVLRGDDSAIVLDTWMARAFGIDANRFANKKVYSACSERVAIVAKSLGWNNAETQAAIWGAVVSKNRSTVPSMFIMPEIDEIPI